MRKLTTREKLILSGLFFSKFDKDGLLILGFEGFSEAFNTIALSLNSKSASIKNYRDEFDPFFPNPRQGWRNRPRRQYCINIMDEFNDLDIESFATLLKTEISLAGDIEEIEDKLSFSDDSSFAKRLITGQAAERYFESIYKKTSEFQRYNLISATGLGCGFDYKMVNDSFPFLAVEVKGMRSLNGSIMLTSKEYKTAEFLENRFFLFVVRNFNETPFHTIFQNPLKSSLTFDRRESVTIQESWHTSIER